MENQKMNIEAFRARILSRLSQVIDPETGVDIVRMRLIEDLVVDENGHVSYKFRPSSPFCPIAIPLSMEIQQAVSEVDGVTKQNFEIVGFAMAEELIHWLKQEIEKS
jgi:metal-sulfur cluster biosynthetic enzyme